MSDVDKAAKTILVAISEHIQAETEKAMADAGHHGAGFLRFGNDGTIQHIPWGEIIHAPRRRMMAALRPQKSSGLVGDGVALTSICHPWNQGDDV